MTELTRFDNQRNLIKGGGGCHLQEKILAFHSNRLFIIADERKRSDCLGDQWRKGIPLEVVPMTYKAVQSYLNREFPDSKTFLRTATEKLGPVITDNGNFIVDFQPSWEHYKTAEALAKLHRRLIDIPGVLETGLFIGMAHRVYIAKSDGTIEVMGM